MITIQVPYEGGVYVTVERPGDGTITGLLDPRMAAWLETRPELADLVSRAFALADCVWLKPVESDLPESLEPVRPTS